MQHITKSQIKLVRSLQQKKFRDQLNLFIAEGDKCINELRKTFELVLLVNADNATPTEIQQISALRTPQGSIAVFKKKQGTEPATCNLTLDTCNLQPVLALDGIQDPGNLGTIIRTADWFGVHHIVCSPDTADCYNPKVVQATMGSLARVHVHYTPLPQWLSNAKGAMTACSDDCAERDNGLTAITRSNHREATIVQQPSRSLQPAKPAPPIFGTLLDGMNMYEVLQQITGDRGQGTGDRTYNLQPTTCNLKPTTCIIVMGNEGNGISPEVRPYITHPIRIPSYSEQISSAGGAMTACSDNCAERDNGLTAITRNNHREATIAQQSSQSLQPATCNLQPESPESLNVAIATAIVLSEFRRLQTK